jgi:hypothetical protein
VNGVDQRRRVVVAASIGTTALLVILALIIGLVVWRSYQASVESGCTGKCLERYTFAVIGDFPYSSQQLKELPAIIDQINNDPDVSLVAHLGDIKEDQPCTTSYYREIKKQFDTFEDPLVYTFGDNEWADCYKESDGNRDPLERLSTLRKVFVPQREQTLGQNSERVQIQDRKYPENVTFSHARVSFGAFHTTGPRNGLVRWHGQEAPTPAQRAEVKQRTAANIKTIRATFEAARSEDQRAVVLFTQADMFATYFKSRADSAPFAPIVRAISDEARNFSGPVYLFNGDTHQYVNDEPLSSGSEWLKTYGVRPLTNFSRVTIDGDENGKNYLKVTIRPDFSKVMSWTRVEFTTAAAARRASARNSPTPSPTPS